MIPIHRLISEHFNQEEIDLLCVQVKVDPDDLPSGGKSSRAQYLFDKMRRLHQTDIFLAAVKRERPFLDLNPYLFYVLADNFYDEDRLGELFEEFGYDVVTFGGRGYRALGSRAWIEEKSQQLQDHLMENGRVELLLAAIQQQNQQVDLSFL
jgi:hypothetical protein